MRIVPKAILTLLAVLTFGAPTSAGGLASWLGIHDDDDRDAVRYNGGWPWVAIGKVDNARGGHCSGTLIDRHLVLTAAHCVSDGRGGMVQPGDLTFSAGFDGNRARASSTARYIHVHPELRFTADGGLEDLSLDWAVLELDRQLYDGGWLRPVPLASNGRSQEASQVGQELAQAGYSGDQSQRLTRNQRCRAEGLASEGRIMLHLCDATFGDSGSPILIERNGNFEIAAVHVAYVRLEDGNYGAAVIPDSYHLP